MAQPGPVPPTPPTFSPTYSLPHALRCSLLLGSEPTSSSSSECHINVTSWRSLPWSPKLSQGLCLTRFPHSAFISRPGSISRTPLRPVGAGPRLSCSRWFLWRLAQHTVGAPRANGSFSQVRLQRPGSWPKGRPGTQPRSANPRACDRSRSQTDTRQTDGQIQMPSSISSPWDSVARATLLGKMPPTHGH